MRLISALAVAALLLFVVGVAHADDVTSDGGDSRIVTIPSDPPPASSCAAGIQATANTLGQIATTDCQVTGSAVTSITLAVPQDDVLGGALSCTLSADGVSLSLIGWQSSSSVVTIGGVTSDECTFTAPPTLTLGAWLVVAATGDAVPLSYVGSSTPYNDHDCDLDDFTLGIPVGCDIGISTPGGDCTSGAACANNTVNTLAFATDAAVDLSGSGVTGLIPFPEPSTLAMLLIGLAPLAFLRRRAAQR